MGWAEFCKVIYTQIEPTHEWYSFYQTKDWYDMPGNIRENDWIYKDTEAVQRARYRHEPGRRFYIYPKDVQHIYDSTPEAARSLLNDIRESLELPVGSPVTYYDLQEYTELDIQTILDFIMES